MNSDSIYAAGALKRFCCILFTAVVLIMMSSLTGHAAERKPETHTILLDAENSNAFEITFAEEISEADPGMRDATGETVKLDGEWQYEETGDWKTPAADEFFAGTWKYYIRITLDKDATISQDGTDFDKYNFFDDTFNVKVNGISWEPVIYQDDKTHEHFLAATSPETYMIEAEDGGELIFIDSPAFDIPESYPEEYIWPFSVANYVSGGASPYTFRKTAGPEWISVNSESGEVSGAPSEEGDNAELMVTVEDAAGASKSIRIKVGKTVHDTISKVKAYGYEPDLFYELDSFFAVVDGEPAEFITDEGRWEKKNGEDWEEVSTGNFTAGTWRYSCPLRISGNVGKLYVLDENAKVTVNGAEWSTSDYIYRADEHLSELSVTSPEYVFDPVDITDHDHFSISVKKQAYTGEAVRAVPSIEYKYGDEEFPTIRKLEEDKDFTLEFGNNVNAGTATVTITGVGDYTGVVTRQFTITPKDITGAVVELGDQEFTGQAVEPAPAVSLDGKTLSQETDYDVSYENNYAIGEATCTVTGKGNYTGIASGSFKITDTKSSAETDALKEELDALKKAYEKLRIQYDTLKVKTTAAKGVKVKLKKRKAVVSYKSLGKGYTYKLFMATRKKGKYKAVNKKATARLSITTGKLKRGKTYYFKVRPYKKVGSKLVAGKYSAVVKKKVK